MIATPAIEVDMISCLEKGAAAAKKFDAERLVPAEGQQTPKRSFYDPLPRSKMKTMSDMQKTARINTKNVSMNGEVMYLRLMAVNAKKKVPLQRVMSYNNYPVPLSLFLDD